jgi:D-glycero-D-manno-heptose 1,7-bisphosphate phosphatase
MRFLFSEPQPNRRGAAIFIDRDGVINRRRAGDYVLHWSQFIFIPGIRGALKELAVLGLPIIVISNQSAVGRGFLDPSVLANITARMHQSLLRDGVPITAVYYCTHTPEDVCVCRKPRPELLRRAATDFSVNLSDSVFIGDSDADMRAAEAAGCPAVLFGPGLTECSDSSDWADGLPVASTAGQLSRVVGELLLNHRRKRRNDIASSAVDR